MSQISWKLSLLNKIFHFKLCIIWFIRWISFIWDLSHNEYFESNDKSESIIIIIIKSNMLTFCSDDLFIHNPNKQKKKKVWNCWFGVLFSCLGPKGNFLEAGNNTKLLIAENNWIKVYLYIWSYTIFEEENFNKWMKVSSNKTKMLSIQIKLYYIWRIKY